ncbi:MAG: type II toxin-antitoxin system HicB family antitoxin [Bacillota bacterium]|nr:type II toxin-antitoxin system HicB family antitoxin [Bacillota bacterium]
MKKETYTFPAILHYADDGISIEFPDLPGCIPCAETTDEAVKNAKEALGLHLFGMEQDKENIPEASTVESLTLKSNEIPLLVEIFMPSVRERLNNRFIKKTLSIPSWLNVEAEKAGINFSGVLQNALKEQLHIDRRI